jgi:AraC-like DNA-binding protein
LLALALNGLGDAEFAITHWAALAHLSERQLRRRVGELTGQSPQTWLREQRLLRVRYLLRSGACKTLAEAGARCGLDNPAYLYRSYRARFGERDS